jgi:hypothetical protein
MSITSAKSGATGISLALDNNFMEPIASTLVGASGVNQVTFSDIPQTYKNLQIRGIARATGAYTNVDGLIQFNGDSAANYAHHGVYGDGASGASTAGTSTVAGRFARNALCANSVTASVFAGVYIDILDYANTNRYKTTRSHVGFDANGSGVIEFYASWWMSNLAITSITLTTDGGNFSQYSRFSLYGFKG